MKVSKLILLAATIALLFSSCEDDPVDPVNEEELITTLTLVFTPQGGGAAKTFSFQDLDGDGGMTPSISADTLADSTVYSVSATFLNESESPSEDITLEIKEEDDEHQVFYEVTGGASATYDYSDTDGTNPLGLQGTFTTTAAGSGKLKVTLLHEPDKSASGVAAGDPTNAGGETDIAIEFNLIIQ